MQKDHSVAENIQMNIQLINFNILLGLSLTSICPTNDIKKIRDNVHSHLCHAKRPMAVSFLTPTPPPPQNGHSEVGKFSKILKAQFSKWRV